MQQQKDSCFPCKKIILVYDGRQRLTEGQLPASPALLLRVILPESIALDQGKGEHSKWPKLQDIISPRRPLGSPVIRIGYPPSSGEGSEVGPQLE